MDGGSVLWLRISSPFQVRLRGFSVGLNLGQFASALAVVPVIALVSNYGNMFLVFGCVALVLAVPYLAALIKEKYYSHSPAVTDIEMIAP